MTAAWPITKVRLLSGQSTGIVLVMVEAQDNKVDMSMLVMTGEQRSSLMEVLQFSKQDLSIICLQVSLHQ